MKAAEILLFLLADLVIIVVAARAMGALARRVGQPAVVGEIVAGMLLGPTVLGRLAPSVPGWLFPQDVPLKEIAGLGLVFFMFLVGLELDTALMKKEGRRALVISLSGIVTPFVLGMLLGWPLASVNAAGVFQEGTTHPPRGLDLLAVSQFGDVHHVLTDPGQDHGRDGSLQVAGRRQRVVRGGR